MKNKMAKPLGFSPATKHRAASVRVCIPLELHAEYGGRKDFRISLGNGDSASLRARATAERAKKDAEFAAKAAALKTAATLLPTPVVTPEHRQAIARGMYAASMAQDDSARESPEVLAALRELAAKPWQSLKIRANSPAAADGMSAVEADTLAALNATAEGAAAVNLARRRLATVEEAADQAARAMGLAVDWTTDSAREALRASLEEQRRAWRDRSQRDSGEAIPPPPAPPRVTPKETTKPKTLWDVLDKWKATNSPSRTHISKTTSAVRMVDSCLGPKGLADYTKPEGADVRHSNRLSMQQVGTTSLANWLPSCACARLPSSRRPPYHPRPRIASSGQ